MIGSQDHTIRVWNLEDMCMECIKVLTGHSRSVLSLLLHTNINSSFNNITTATDNNNSNDDLSSEDSKLLPSSFPGANCFGGCQDSDVLISCSSDNTIRIWSIEGLCCLISIQGFQSHVLSMVMGCSQAVDCAKPSNTDEDNHHNDHITTTPTLYCGCVNTNIVAIDMGKIFKRVCAFKPALVAVDMSESLNTTSHPILDELETPSSSANPSAITAINKANETDTIEVFDISVHGKHADLVRSVKEHHGYVYCVAISTDKKTLFSGSGGEFEWLELWFEWDAETQPWGLEFKFRFVFVDG